MKGHYCPAGRVGQLEAELGRDQHAILSAGAILPLCVLFRLAHMHSALARSGRRLQIGILLRIARRFADRSLRMSGRK
jgi:hypothetical protein